VLPPPKRFRSQTLQDLGHVTKAMVVSSEDAARLESLFAAAIHSSALPFNCLDSPQWNDFFSFGMPAWKRPSPKVIGDRLLFAEETAMTASVLNQLRKSPSLTVTIDGATQHHDSILNVMLCDPRPYFYGHINMNLKRETSENMEKTMVEKFREIIAWLNPNGSNASPSAAAPPSTVRCRRCIVY
jgi:hypothetical protein